jgi:hypothetical protein
MSSEEAPLGSETREYGEHQRRRERVQAERYRQYRIEEAITEANRALVTNEYVRAGLLARDVLVPGLQLEVPHLDSYDTHLADSSLAWDWDAITRFVADPDRYLSTMIDVYGRPQSFRLERYEARLQSRGESSSQDIAERTIRRAVKSLESIAVAQGILPSELSQSSTVSGHRLQVGLKWQSYDYETPDDVQVVNPRIHPPFHLSIGDPGNGKSTSLDTLAEDAYHAGHKVIDLLDFGELENAMYDVPSQDNALQKVRRDFGLPESFEDHPDYERPDVEILHPLTRGFCRSDLPYDTEVEEFTAQPFVVPAASIDHSSLKAMMPHLTDTQENYLTEALESLADKDDWALDDLVKAVLGTAANDGVKRRLHAAIKTLDDRGFIGTYEHEYAIDWESIFRDTDTITVFSCSLMDQDLHKLMVASYLLDAIYEERQPDTPDSDGNPAASTQYPRAMIVMREMQDAAPGGRKTKGGDASKSRIQSKLVSRMQTLGEKRRHVNMGILGDTQKWLQVDAGVRENIDRVMSFKNSPGVVQSVFETVIGGNHFRHAEKLKDFDRGECVVIGPEWLSTNQPFIMPVQWAPPLCHHLDSETEPAGWYARVQYLDHEELRESPFELGQASVSDSVVEDARKSRRTPKGFEGFIEECIEVDGDDPQQRLIKAHMRAAYLGYADEHDLDVHETEEQIGQWFRAHIDPDLCPTAKELGADDPNNRRETYKYAALTDTGLEMLDRGQHLQEDQ